MVRAFCKKHRICARCFRERSERGTKRSRKCNRAHAKAQKVRLRQNYDRDTDPFHVPARRLHKGSDDTHKQHVLNCAAKIHNLLRKCSSLSQGSVS